MIRKIKMIQLKDGKQLYYPSDGELKELWGQVEEIEIEEKYTIEEWKSKFVVIRTDINEELYKAWRDKTKLW